MTLTLEHIQIGWISALPVEALLAEIMLDEVIEQMISLPRYDNNIYTYGRIRLADGNGSHIVAIAQLPLSSMGQASAATVANNMRRTFPNLKFGIMVGIAGGVWTLDQDVRLGDIVVGIPDDGGPGIVQYDYGKAVQNGEFIMKGSMNKAPEILRSAAGLLKRKHMRRPGLYVSSLDNEEVKQHASRPSADNLFSATYVHQGGTSCVNCSKNELCNRPSRSDQIPKVHYGAVASGDKVVKDALLALKLQQKHNILCFEMEAAGLDAFPCLVVRGISDYADSHKNDEWHAYAAATAAAYAREVLTVVPQTAVSELPSIGNKYWNVPRPSSPLFTGREDLLQKMKEDLVQSDQEGQQPRRVFVLHGIGGAGKSEAATRFAEDNRDSFWGVFWIDGENKKSIEDGFEAIARTQTPHLPDTSSKKVLEWLANIKYSWLLILDNCDDNKINFWNFIPSYGGSIVITTRLVECQKLGVWKTLDDLGYENAIQLLLKACGIEDKDGKTQRHYAEAVVSCLGPHALALVHAGAYIRKGHCSLQEYPDFFQGQQRKLMNFRPEQLSSRYGSVYTTFEVSAEILASSNDDTSRTALGLLSILAFLDREDVREDMFLRAFEYCLTLEGYWRLLNVCGQYYVIRTYLKPTAEYMLSQSDRQSVSDVSDLSRDAGSGCCGVESAEDCTSDSDSLMKEPDHDGRVVSETNTPTSGNGDFNVASKISVNSPDNSEASDSSDVYGSNATRTAQAGPAGDNQDAANSGDPSNKDEDSSEHGTPEDGSIPHIDSDAHMSNFSWYKAYVSYLEAGVQHEDGEINHLDLWHCSQIRSTGLMESPDVSDLREARVRLSELSLIRVQDDTISMHPLVHEWARTRLNEIEFQRAWQQTLCTLALSAQGSYVWEPFTMAMRSHLEICFRSWPERDSQTEIQLSIARSLDCIGWQLYRADSNLVALEIFQQLCVRCHPLPHTRSCKSQILLFAQAICLMKTKSDGDIDKAQQLLEQVVEARSIWFPEDSEDVINSRKALANLYAADGKVHQAVSMLEGIVALPFQPSKMRSKYRLHALESLARVYLEVGEHQKAVTLLEEVVETESQTLQPSDRSRLASMDRLAEAYINVEKSDEAVSLLEEVVELRSQTLQPNDTSRLVSMDRLAAAYIELSQYDEAVSLLEEVVQLGQMDRGSASAASLPIHAVWSLSDAYICLTEHHKAAVLLEPIVGKGSDPIESDDEVRIDLAEQLARAYEGMGPDGNRKAISLYRIILQVHRQTKESTDVTRLEIMHNLAQAHLNADELDDATNLLEEIVEIDTKSLSSDDKNRLASMQRLSYAYQRNGDRERSIPLLEHLVAEKEKVAEPDDEQLIELHSDLAKAYLEIHEVEKAINLFKLVVNSRSKFLPSEHEDRLASMDWLANAYLEVGDNVAAEILLEELVEIEARIFPVEDKGRLISVRELALAYMRFDEAYKIEEAIILLETVMERGKETLHSDAGELAYTQELLTNARERLREIPTRQKNTGAIRFSELSDWAAETLTSGAARMF